MANALTAVRLLLALPLGLLVASPDSGAPMLAAAAMLVAILTDLTDGPVARRSGTASAFGGTFDHTTDFLFVVSGMAGGVVRGVIPLVLPILVATAFVQYVTDSYWLHGHTRLRGSRLGRYNCIFYFVPICGDILVRLGLVVLAPAVTLVCWLLVLSTCLSIGERLMLLRAARRTDPGSPS